MEERNGVEKAKGAQKPRVLIAGASFAGLSAAWWMSRLGYAVTVVEIAKGLRKGGTPVDIREGVVDVVQRMGLLERIARESLPARAMEFLDGDGRRITDGHGGAAEAGAVEYEIERDALLDMLFDEVKGRAEILFDDSLCSIEETADGVSVAFANGSRRSFDLLLGCDGTHSAVRRMVFGAESEYLLFLKNYFSLTIVDKLLIEENTSQMFNIAGKCVMLNAYHGKTDIGFCFHTDEQISYDRRNREEQRRMIAQQFKREGWRIPELLEEMRHCEDFYFDQLCQIRMNCWSKGRVALVGDAGYCPSPAAGMGGSMAILGAAALGEAFAQHPGNYQLAFQSYEEALRPTVEQIQSDAVEIGLKMFLPQTPEELRERNLQLGAER